MTSCSNCGHENKAYFRPEDIDFIKKNAPDEPEFYRALMVFINDYEKIRNRIARDVATGQPPNPYATEIFRKYYDIMVNIDMGNTCGCECDSDGLY